jgi:hypothetical protein
MRLRRINNLFRWLVNNPVIILLAALASILSYFDIRNGVQQALNLVGIESNLVASIVTFGVVPLVLIVLLSIIGYLIDRRYRKKLRIYSSSVESVLWQDAAGERIKEFQELRSDAKDSMLVMGIGMTFFSNDLSYLKTLLEKDLKVRLLMINPEIISRPSQEPNEDYSTIIKSNLFDDYFDRQEYSADIRSSFNRLRTFILERKKIQNKKGIISLKKYPYFIPMNVTIIDEKSDKKDSGRMLIEWCLPFSDWRISSSLSSSQHKEFFKIINKNIQKLWDESDMVIGESYQKMP